MNGLLVEDLDQDELSNGEAKLGNAKVIPVI